MKFNIVLRCYVVANSAAFPIIPFYSKLIDQNSLQTGILFNRCFHVGSCRPQVALLLAVGVSFSFIAFLLLCLNFGLPL